jgi:hypothetical protein
MRLFLKFAEIQKIIIVCFCKRFLYRRSTYDYCLLRLLEPYFTRMGWKYSCGGSSSASGTNRQLRRICLCRDRVALIHCPGPRGPPDRFVGAHTARLRRVPQLRSRYDACRRVEVAKLELRSAHTPPLCAAWGGERAAGAAGGGGTRAMSSDRAVG